MNKLTFFRSIMTKVGRRRVIKLSDIKNYLLCKKKEIRNYNKLAVYLLEVHLFT